MSKIFINYRRQDSQYAAGRIADRLISHFGQGRVFIDVETIQPGVDFLEVIERVIGESGVMVSIIGPRWSEFTDSQGEPRLLDPGDPVRLELEMAVAGNLRVLPVLVDGAKMPSPDQLPDSLEGVSRRHAVTVAHERFRQDAGGLIDAVEEIVGPPVDESLRPDESGEKPIGRVLTALGDTIRRTAAVESPGVETTLKMISTATISALITAGAMFALALVLAIQTGSASLLDLSGGTAGTVKEAFNQISAFSLGLFRASSDQTEMGVRVTPALFGLLMAAVSALSTFLLAGRLRNLPIPTRLFWGGTVGLPLAVIMVVFSLLAGTTDVTASGPGIDTYFAQAGSGSSGSFKPMAGSVFLFSLLWGSLGGVVGARGALRREEQLSPLAGLKWVSGVRGIVWAVLRPLVMLLLVCALVGTAVWSIQTARGVAGIGTDEGRAKGVVAVENGLYVADYAVNFAALGSLSPFNGPGQFGVLGLPVPVTKLDSVIDTGTPEDRFGRGERQSLTLLSYGSALPVVLFIPSLGLIVLVLLLAADAGFSIARNRAVDRLEQGAAWGALTGPLWALPMLLVNALFLKQLMGEARGSGVFVTFLVIGAVGGALGGGLASASQPRAKSVDN